LGPKGLSYYSTLLYHSIKYPFKVSMKSVSLIKPQVCGTGRQFAKSEARQKLLDFCRLATRLGRAADNTNTYRERGKISMLHICCVNVKAKVHPCTGTEALYRPYGPQRE
jgi:hypothetical protein